MTKSKQKTVKKNVLLNLILDRSGSMATVKNATISSVNEYLGKLRADKKVNYTVTVTLFDDRIEKPYVNVPLKDVKDFTEKTFVPRGFTALYDAVCKTINEVKEKKGQKVITVIVTDGEENSSKEYNEKTLKALIEAKDKWTFLFLGANQDSYATATRYGIHTTNAVNFVASNAGITNAIHTLANVTYTASIASGTSGFYAKIKDVNVTVTI